MGARVAGRRHGGSGDGPIQSREMRTAPLRRHPRRLAAGGLVAGMLALAAWVAPIAHGKALCSSFGTTWARNYDHRAARDQNPTRIIAACCKPIKNSDLNSCVLTIGEVGVREHGCEQVDLSPAGNVASEGRRVACH
jgi:hypothetical protein